MSINVNMTWDQYKKYFETFLQYGDIKNAKFVFVGLEEGAGDMPIDKNIEARLAWRESISDSIKYLDSFNKLDLGYYIDDLVKADIARQRYVNSDFSIEDLKTTMGKTMAMLFQARLRMILENNFEYLEQNSEKDLTKKEKDTLHKKMLNETKNYLVNNLHKEGNQSAMIDYYPLPSNNKEAWYYNNIFNTRKEYKKYINDKNSTRRQLIKNLYETCPIDVSIIYAGKSAEKELESFYEDMGFDLKGAEIRTMDQVNDEYKWLIEDEIIKPEIQSKNQFKISKRIRKDGKVQWLFVTPFFGNGQMSYYGLYTIATWIAAKLNE